MTTDYVPGYPESPESTLTHQDWLRVAQLLERRSERFADIDPEMAELDRIAAARIRAEQERTN